VAESMRAMAKVLRMGCFSLLIIYVPSNAPL
jgi:hypothetical protein